jgi:choline-sulfatase
LVFFFVGGVPGGPHDLQSNGNPVTSIGKLHYQDGEISSGFDEQIIPMHVYGGGDLHGLIRDEPRPRPQSRKLTETIGPGESEFTIYDRDIARHACSWLRDSVKTQTDKPWTLFVSFICPHFPLTAPEDYFARYDPSRIPLPKAKPKRPPKLRAWWDAFEGCYTFNSYFRDDGHRQAALAGYFALCSFIDDLVGSVVGTLDEAGLTDSTRIAYVSDHGDNLGARGLWAKSTMYEESVGVPLILAGPGVAAGRTVETPVSLIDFHPTILHCAGLSDGEPDHEHPGRSLLHLADEPDDTSRIVFSEYHATAAKSAQFMLRKGDLKYIHYVGHGEELFDLRQDPEELQDLASSPAHADVCAKFRNILRAMLDPDDVDAQAKSDQQQVIERLGGRDAVLAMPVPYATPAPEA